MSHGLSLNHYHGRRLTTLYLSFREKKNVIYDLQSKALWALRYYYGTTFLKSYMYDLEEEKK